MGSWVEEVLRCVECSETWDNPDPVLQFLYRRTPLTPPINLLRPGPILSLLWVSWHWQCLPAWHRSQSTHCADPRLVFLIFDIDIVINPQYSEKLPSLFWKHFHTSIRKTADLQWSSLMSSFKDLCSQRLSHLTYQSGDNCINSKNHNIDRLHRSETGNVKM